MQGLLLLALGTLLAGSAGTTVSAEPPRPEPEPPVPPSPPGQVLQAFLAEVRSQSKPKAGEHLLEVLEKFATIGTPEWAAVALPCDPRIKGIPPKSFWANIAETLADTWDIPYKLIPTDWSTPEGASVDMCLVVFHRGPIPVFTQESFAEQAAYGALSSGDREFLDRWFTGIRQDISRANREVVDQFKAQREGRYGAVDVLGTIINAMINAAVGMVTTLTMQGLIRAMGGEARLGRLVRRYDRKKGNKKARGRIRGKIRRIVSRLKRKEVPWERIDKILRQDPALDKERAPPPPRPPKQMARR